MTEKELQTNIIHLAELFGYRVFHVVNYKGQLRNETAVGYPDLTLCKKGRLIFAELKVGRNKLTDHQTKWLSKLRESVDGVEVFLWTDKDWMDGTIEEVLTR